MLLKEEMVSSGDFLFRWRGLLPLLFVGPILWVALNSEAVSITGNWSGGNLLTGMAVVLVILGIVIRAFTIGFVPSGTSGRNTKAQRASCLNTTGPYSISRNPLYLGNCAIYLGVLLYLESPMLALAGVLFMALYYERIILREEAFLSEKFGAAYKTWVGQVPVFFPNFSLWQMAELKYSTRFVLKREYPGWFYASLAFAIIDLLRWVASGQEWRTPLSLSIFAGIALVCGIVRFMKKKTNLLIATDR